jgi:hypothetical protein
VAKSSKRKNNRKRNSHLTQSQSYEKMTIEKFMTMLEIRVKNLFDVFRFWPIFTVIVIVALAAGEILR